MRSAHYVAYVPYGGMDTQLLAGPFASYDEADFVRPAVEATYPADELEWDRIDVMAVRTSGDLRPGRRNAEFGLPGANGAVA